MDKKERQILPFFFIIILKFRKLSNPVCEVAPNLRTFLPKISVLTNFACRGTVRNEHFKSGGGGGGAWVVV